MNFYKFFSTFVGHFCPPGSGSGFRIRIRIHRLDWIRIRIRNPGYDLLLLQAVPLLMFTLFTSTGIGFWKLKIVLILSIFICRKYFTEREAALIVRDVASALEFLHSKGQYCTSMLYFLFSVYFFLRVTEQKYLYGYPFEEIQVGKFILKMLFIFTKFCEHNADINEDCEALLHLSFG